MKPFLVAKHSQGSPSVYEPMDVLPPGVKIGRYGDHAFHAVEPFLAHGKPYGLKKDKPVELEVYGVSGEYLLVKLRDPSKVEMYEGYRNDALGWLTVRFDQTTEGWRFVRSVVKAMKVLVSVAKKAGIEQRKRERNRAAAKAREGREGTCQICEGRQIIQPTGANKSTLVLHGYKRPGHGYTIGNCYGYHRLPFEVACDALKEWVALLANEVATTKELLAKLPERTTLQVSGGWKKPDVDIGPDDPRWDAAMKAKKWELESELRIQTHEHARQAERLANWKPEPTWMSNHKEDCAS